jgi:hypothetical protein
MPPIGSGFTVSRTRGYANAEATSSAAVKVVLERIAKENDRTADFVTDAYAIAYHRAAGLYAVDREMQELGTAVFTFLQWQRHT